MISRRQLPELRAYAQAEAALPVRFRPEYASLVVPNGNETRPVHRWFKYKEAFSANLLDHLLRRVELGLAPTSTVRLLDPFCGVGTSLVSSQLLKSDAYSVEAIGVECNPFSAFVARTKASWPLVDPVRLRALGSGVLANVKTARSSPLPDLSSIKSGRCISGHAARQIIAIRDKLRAMQPSVERDVLVVGLASCIEMVSKIRRDGRALRLVTKPRAILRRLLADRWECMAKDVERLRESCPKASRAEVVLGDGRRPGSSGVGEQTIDLILTSPPYPNNIDYNEVYKLELWLLGFVSSNSAFLDLRRETYRSHPTCSPVEGEKEQEAEFAKLLEKGPLADLLGMVLRRAQTLDRQSSRGRSKVLFGYAYDTWCSLRAHRRLLKPGAFAVYVVGNSLHGAPEKPYLIPTDLVLACLAELVGFKVEHLIVARPLQRRLAGNHFLRDSLLILRNV